MSQSGISSVFPEVSPGGERVLSDFSFFGVLFFSIFPGDFFLRGIFGCSCSGIPFVFPSTESRSQSGSSVLATGGSSLRGGDTRRSGRSAPSVVVSRESLVPGARSHSGMSVSSWRGGVSGKTSGGVYASVSGIFSEGSMRAASGEFSMSSGSPLSHSSCSVSLSRGSTGVGVTSSSTVSVATGLSQSGMT